MKVLLVEDDEYIAQALSTTLTEQHYTVDVAYDGQAGWEYAEAFTYDLILLDVVLPKLDGISLCRQLRSRHTTTPILLLTSCDSSASKIEGLDAGADDYVVKPFDFLELSARIRAILRRGSAALPPILETGKLRLNPNNYEVIYDDQPLNLTPKEYALLELFLRNTQRVFSRRAILDHLWSFEEPPAEDTVRAHIKGLRSKLKAAGAPPDLVETVYGLGYRLKPEKREEILENSELNTPQLEDLSLPSLPPELKNSSSLEDRINIPETASIVTQSNSYNALLSSKESSLSDAIAKVWERFRSSISDRIAILDQTNVALNLGQLSDELRQQASQEVHKLVGSLGTFGLAEGSRLAREMENLLQSDPKQDQAPQLCKLVATLREELERWKGGAGERGRWGDGGDGEVKSSLSSPSSLSSLSSPSPFLLIVDEDESFTDELVVEANTQGLRTEVVTNLSVAREAFCSSNRNGNSLYPDVVLIDLNLNDGERGSREGDRQQTFEQGKKESEKINCPTTASCKQHQQRWDSSESESITRLESSYQLLADFTHLTPPVPVVVFARHGNFTERVEVARLGGRAFLQKPVLPAQAIEVVLDAIRRSRTAEAKVMVVDDDPYMLAALRLLLEPWGVKTLTLDDPRQFWETLEVVVPDLLILDIEMPYLTGIELCLTVRNDPRWSGVPILFLTAHTDAKTVHQVFAAGGDDYVTKPIVGPELVNRIFNRLERSQLLRSRAETDALTGVANRRRSTQDLSQFLHLADRHNQSLCFALLDLDCFKQVNDEYGHAMGDTVLRRLGELLLRTFGGQDVVARWGGEEFVVGMYGMTKRDAIKSIDDVLINWRSEEFVDTDDRKFRVSFSAGIAEYPSDGNDLQALYRAADEALYRAKAAGRDRVMGV
ncbi:response regulator [Kamptonema animale CS-326]|jgi:diguanylate cyclase (GGDEF)-like protein|uniref:response regulator n=1 Tax=Kamptonema animale TaxID=92934 RepID=UPI00232EB588|nr:response regulator [Kamptonema animale]MDB9513766.1 response regulator [Kamptonema animale CS-326]